MKGMTMMTPCITRTRITRTRLLAGLLGGLFAFGPMLAAQADSSAASQSGASGPASGSASRKSDSAQGAARGQGASQQRSATPQQTLPPGVTGLLVLLPVGQATDPNMANGCWVRFYENKNFRGDMLTLVGPIDMANMDAPGPAWQDWDSAVVGPKAQVTTFDNEGFRERTATLSAGAHISDLGDTKLGWFEEVKSARVRCTG
jgi:hypothetical protein